MADPKELDFGQGSGLDAMEAALLNRKREQAKAQLMQILNQGVPTYKRSPIAAGLDFMTGLGAKNQIQSVDAQELARFRENKAGEAAGMKEMLEGMLPQSVPQAGPPQEGQGALPNIMQPADPRAAILKALTSQYPGVRGLGQTLYKDNASRFDKVVGDLKDRLSVDSVLKAAPTTDFNKLQAGPPLADPVGQTFTTPEGNKMPAVVTTNIKNEKQVHFPPAASQVNVDTAGKPGMKVLEKFGEALIPGGKQYEAQSALQEQLSTNQELLHTLSANPSMGAGGDFFQAARKWAQTLGVPETALTTPTEQAKMQMYNAVFSKLGGLGNQISDADRKFVMDAMGSLSSDPAALRRVLMIQSKYAMRLLAKMNAEADPVREKLRDYVPIPQYHFNFKVPDLYGDEMGYVMGDKSSPYQPPQIGPRSELRPIK